MKQDEPIDSAIVCERRPGQTMPGHYDRAPIAEAIIDLRVEWPADAPADVFDRLAERFKDTFPKCEPIRTIAMGFHAEVGHEPSFVTGAEVVGSRLNSSSGQRVLQIQRSGFTYSHLPPYSDWKSFSAEAVELWRSYVEVTQVSRVIRTAVRVINKFALPGSVQDLPTFTNLLPKTPRELALEEGDGYFMQLQRGLKIEGARVIVNTGRAKTPEGRWEFLLDLDLFNDYAIDAASPDIWAMLQQLSDAKNDLFEACITDEFRRLIK